MSRVVERSVRYACPAQVGTERIMFGTDHPFFPPLKAADKWMSVVENLDAIESIPSWTGEQKDDVCGNNAINLLGLGSVYTA